jgi:hypothetical protein
MCLAGMNLVPSPPRFVGERGLYSGDKLPSMLSR